MSDQLPVKQIPVPTQLHMTRKVFAAICETIGTRRAETGGILGGNRQTCEVTHFFFDDAPHQKSRVMYTPNTARLNEVRRNQWKPEGIAYLGSIHSHPPSFRRPSSGDEVSAGSILETLDIPYLLVPIVTTLVDTGSVTLHPFAASLNGGRVKIIEQELWVGGTLIRPLQPVMPERSADAQENLLILMEMEVNLAAMLYGSLPCARMHPLYQRRYRYHRRKELDND